MSVLTLSHCARLSFAHWITAHHHHHSWTVVQSSITVCGLRVFGTISLFRRSTWPNHRSLWCIMYTDVFSFYSSWSRSAASTAIIDGTEFEIAWMLVILPSVLPTEVSVLKFPSLLIVISKKCCNVIVLIKFSSTVVC